MLEILPETFGIEFKVKLWVWGSHQFTVTLGGAWNMKEKALHINCKELLAGRVLLLGKF